MITGNVMNKSVADTMKKLKRCMMSGVTMQKVADMYKTPVIYTENATHRKSVKVPHSELAMHSRAAGAEISAVTGAGRMCMVSYITADGRCGTVEGLTSEVMPRDFYDEVKTINKFLIW